jgi:RNA recognition motif-containing protein
MSRLYVGNLSWDTTQDSLRSLFESGGRTVKDVHIVSDRETGRPRGFAFVEMGSKAEADAAIAALDGADLDGRQIKVNEAKERAPRPGGGGGGFGGGGRGGGGGGGGGRGGGGGGYGGGGGGGSRGRDRW